MSYFSASVAAQGLSTPWEQAILDAAGSSDRAALVKGVIAAESAWDPNAERQEPQINDASEGLMQVLLSTARGYVPGLTRDQLRDPVTNISIGTRYLLYQLGRYGGNEADAVSAYNHGSAWRKPSGGYYNQNYVDTVLQYWTYYLNAAAPTDTTGQPAPAGLDLGALAAGGGAAALALLAAGLYLVRR